MQHLERFSRVEEKVESGEPLSREEAVFLFQPEIDLHRLGQLADRLKRKHSGLNVFYNANAHLNPTNICKFRCPLCAFSCDQDSEKAYFMDAPQILQYVQSAVHDGCTQLHWVGGLPEDVPYSFYRDTLGEIHRRFPKLQLKAWTAVEIHTFAEMSGKNVREILLELRENGLSALPGGGAEIFDPDVRKRIAPRKPSAEQWIEVHRRAHELGIASNATMLFGGVESVEHRVDHLLRIRELQEESIREGRPARFETCVPLVFHPSGTAFSDRDMIASHEILRTIAISRVVLHNIAHIKAYWITLGVELAQIALGYGADDFDGTVRKERIHHEAGSKSPEGLSEQKIRELIEETGRIPVKR